jgi:hypothetical protein
MHRVPQIEKTKDKWSYTGYVATRRDVALGVGSVSRAGDVVVGLSRGAA